MAGALDPPAGTPPVRLSAGLVAEIPPGYEAQAAVRFRMVEGAAYSEAKRGSGGFGSTGI